MIEYIEYQVFEKADGDKEWWVGDKEWWYPHGSKHNNLRDGMGDLLYKQELYAKYGREFKLQTRTISEWTEV